MRRLWKAALRLLSYVGPVSIPASRCGGCGKPPYTNPWRSGGCGRPPYFSLLANSTTYWIRMIRATSPPAAQPMGLLKCSGQMTHPAYTSPPQMIAPANAPKALSSSRMLVTSFIICERRLSVARWSLYHTDRNDKSHRNPRLQSQPLSTAFPGRLSEASGGNQQTRP
jgi:hypothetical protein